jgi:rhamnosyltransferase
MISVVIPVKDGGRDLGRCLGAIRRQKLDDDVEIVAVDSGSVDDSVAIARAHEARVLEIAPHEFNHGRARNLGASRATGEVLVFISQDAVPVDGFWLERLTRPLRERLGLGGAYGRQLPHQTARPPEVFFLDFLYGPHPRVQRAASIDALSMETTLFSNVNAAMPRDVWERFPFAEDIVMSEDQEWAQRVLLAGFELAYEPAAAVWHSHDYTVAGAFRRFFDSGVSADRAYLAGSRHSTRVLCHAALRYASREVAWLIRSGQGHWIPYAVVYETAKLTGLFLGANHRRLPSATRRRWSCLPMHWEQQELAGAASVPNAPDHDAW